VGCQASLHRPERCHVVDLVERASREGSLTLRVVRNRDGGAQCVQRGLGAVLGNLDDQTQNRPLLGPVWVTPGNCAPVAPGPRDPPRRRRPVYPYRCARHDLTDLGRQFTVPVEIDGILLDINRDAGISGPVGRHENDWVPIASSRSWVS